MKRKFVLIVAAALFAIGSSVFIGCGGAEEHSEGEEMHEHSEGEEHEHAEGEGHEEEAGDDEHVFACPMHPEITGAEGDKCSKCSMDLEMVAHEH